MWRYILNRLFWAVPVLFLVTLVTFTAMKLTPGGPFTAGTSGRPLPPRVKAQLNEIYGFNDPAWKQYLNYMGGLLRLDFGPSYKFRGRTVNDLMFQGGLLKAPLSVSAQLGLVAVGVALVIGIPAGIVSALKQNSWLDYLAMFVAMMGVSVPNFVLGLILIWIFALTLHWLPTYGWGETPLQAVMPALTLGTGGAAFIARLTRASMLETIRADYIRTARAKGLRERVVIWRHAIKNSMIPVVTILGPLLAAWLTGTFLVEYVFSIPGIGKMYVTSINDRDYTLIMGTTVVYAVALVFFNLAVDIAYVFIDPRIRFD
ncbi:MAG: ABC transporter permease [Chloroflexi bacterium]|nr:ABC transporter permease [Chloroflexota bacterium]